MSDDLIDRLRECAECKSSEAWGRIDGGQDLCIGAALATEAAAELSRLRAEVERLTGALEGALADSAQLTLALADERRHADALAEALTTFIEGGNRQLALISRKVRVTDPMTLTVTKGQLLAAIEARAAHRARRQG